MIQGTDGVTQTVNHLLQGGKDFVSEATLPNFLPNLFYRIHFRCVRRNVKQNNIVRQLQNGGSVPCRTITAKQNNIISVFFRQLLQKDIHADSIAIGQDEKVPIACQRLHCAVSIAVLTDMMAGHAGTNTVPAPTVFRLVDPTKSSFILKHKPNVFDSIPTSEKAGTLYLQIYPYVDPDKITTMFLFATSPLLSQSGNTKSSIKGNTLKEPLNKTPTADDGSFPPILRFEKWEICRSRWRQRSHTDAGMPFAGTQSIPSFSKPCLDEKSLAVHSR